MCLSRNFLAEGTGFEPAELSLACFQDRYHQPLGHPSMDEYSMGKGELTNKDKYDRMEVLPIGFGGFLGG